MSYTDPHEAAKAVFKGDLVPRALSFAQFREEMTIAYSLEPLTDEFLYELYAQYGPDQNAFHDFWESRPKSSLIPEILEKMGDAQYFETPVSEGNPEDLFGPANLDALMQKAEKIAEEREWLEPYIPDWDVGDIALVRTKNGDEYLAKFSKAEGIDYYWYPLTPRPGDALWNPVVAASPVPPEHLPTPSPPGPFDPIVLEQDSTDITALIEKVAGIDDKIDKVQELQNRLYRMEVARQAQQRKNKRAKFVHKVKNKFRRRRR